MLFASKNIWKIASQSLYCFCKLNSKNKEKPFMSLNVLRQAVERQHFFVRKNYQEIGNQLLYNIQSNRWGTVKKILLIININQLDSWLVLRKMAKAINTTCNNLKITEMNQHIIEQLLSVLVLLRFEAKKSKDNYTFKGQKMQFDDSSPFISQLEKYINQVSIQNETYHYFQLARKLLHTNPYLFLSKRQLFQLKILSQLESLIQDRSLLNDLLMKGCISNFWSTKFKSQLLNKNIAENFKKSLRFEDLGLETKIKQSSVEGRLKTQNEIMNILQGYGYEVKQNVSINGYQVDFLIANKLIVQYNGHHHYIINSDQLIPTAKDKWKQNLLMKRHFAVSNIPYPEWKILKLFEEKRNYLIAKIQKDWLRYHKFQKKNKQ